jgi:Uma2 family endonuclease
MADNTKQFEWIVTIESGFDWFYENDPNVFVAGDLLWYPVEGSNTIRQAPDTMIIFGRPKGHRSSYRQWEEGNIPPQVVFEVWSPGNRAGEMKEKRDFYEQYGVQEYYEYDPDRGKLFGWLYQGSSFVRIQNMQGFVSPLTGVRFGLNGNDLELTTPNGEVFVNAMEVRRQKRRAEERAEQEQAAKERAWAKLRELGIDPESL